MARTPLLNFERNLMKACRNLGKGLIQQCLQCEALPGEGTLAFLSEACHSLSKDILDHADKSIKEEGRVTQKTILSLACRKLAELIKAQCPRGEGEFSRNWEALESILSEPSLTTKLAEIINARELVECVCSRHELGLSTVLLAACHWLVADMNTLFLCEEVWSNLFCKEGFVQHALYSQIRLLLSTVMFQITLEAHILVPGYLDRREQAMRHHRKERPHSHQQELGNCDMKASHKGLPGKQRMGHGSDATKQQRLKGHADNLRKARYLVTEVDYEDRHIDMVINDRASRISYIVEIRNDPSPAQCRSAIKKLWLVLTQPVEELCEEKVCYLLTVSRHPIRELGLCAPEKDEDGKFLRDVTVSRVGYPIWPKDKSVIKRWFLYPEDQRREELGDQGNKCLQIWRVGSQALENRHLGRPREVIKDLESLKTDTDMLDNSTTETKAARCFHFFKKSR